MKKVIVLVSALALAAFALVGCGGGAAPAASSASADAAASASADAAASASADAVASADAAASASAAATPAAAKEDPTKENPIIVDKENGEIRYLGFVDGAYVGENAEPTRHAVVYEAGSNGHKTIITGYGDEKEFYQGCIDLGWEPGNNLTLAQNKNGGDPNAIIEGELLDVLIHWDGQEDMPIWDCFEASNGDQRPAEWHFGGNLERAEEKNTGCVLCIDSCAVGIVSNAAWPAGTTDADGVTYFSGKPDVLPADGTDVVITFKKAA